MYRVFIPNLNRWIENIPVTEALVYKEEGYRVERMNNRIKEFAQQESDKEKLVELIVETCASLANLPASTSGQWNHLTPAQTIKKFFGIEERMS